MTAGYLTQNYPGRAGWGTGQPAGWNMGSPEGSRFPRLHPQGLCPGFPDTAGPQTTQEETLWTTPDLRGCHSRGFTAASGGVVDPRHAWDASAGTNHTRLGVSGAVLCALEARLVPMALGGGCPTLVSIPRATHPRASTRRGRPDCRGEGYSQWAGVQRQREGRENSAPVNC